MFTSRLSKACSASPWPGPTRRTPSPRPCTRCWPKRPSGRRPILTVRVILFRAEGDSFCAGNDIGDFIAIGSQTDEPLDMSVFRFLKALAELDRPRWRR